MAKATKNSEKQILQEQIAYQLEHSLGKVKDLLGKKKFNSRVKKSVKLFTQGLGKDKKKLKKDILKPVNGKVASVPERVDSEIEVPLTPSARKKAAAKKNRTPSISDQKTVS